MKAKRGFFKTLLGIGSVVALAGTINFSSIKTENQQIDRTYQQIYTQQVESNTYKYNKYKKAVQPQINLIDKRIKELFKGDTKTIPTESERKIMYKNMAILNPIIGFKSNLDYLDNLCFNEWKGFAEYDSSNNISTRYKQLLDTFGNLSEKIIETKENLEKVTLQFNNSKSLSTKESENLGRLIYIYSETLEKSYKLIDWYKLMMLEKIEYYRIHNPKDSLAKMSKHIIFLKKFNELKFNLNNI